MFDHLNENCKGHLEAVSRLYPFTPLKYLQKTLQLTFQEGIETLKKFRDFLRSEGFTNIHTPKLIGGTSEGGAAVFRLDYKGQPACLAQSPQLHKQMSISGDLRRVYETGDEGEVGNGNLFLPGFIPKVPRRFYYLFGKPISNTIRSIYEELGKYEDLENQILCRERVEEH